MRSRRRASTRAAGSLLATLGLAIAMPSATRAADPFYEGLLAEGATAYERGLYPAATEAFHLACFGLLEEPPRLAACLVKLGLAQAAAGDPDGLRESFERIGQIEDRFGAYREALIPEEERLAFETELARHVPRTQLGQVPLLQERARDAAAEQIATLPARERRKAIEARLRRNAADALALSLLVELELASNRKRRALEAADELIAATPDNPESRCLRGRALAADDRCSEAVPDLGLCAREQMGAQLAETALSCLARIERWSAASDLLAELPPATRSAPAVQRLADQVEAALSRPSDEEPEPATEEEILLATAEPVDNPGGSPVEPAASLPPSLAPSMIATGPHPATAELESLRREVDTVATREALEGLYQRVAALANRHPDFPEAQYVAGRVAYLGKRWQEAADFFRRGGQPPSERAELLFYMAVAYFESGDGILARELIEAALPRLERTAFVRSYVDRILTPDAAAGQDAPELN